MSVRAKVEKMFATAPYGLPDGVLNICDVHDQGIAAVRSNRDLKPEAVDRLIGEQNARTDAALKTVLEAATAGVSRELGQEEGQIRASFKPKTIDPLMPSHEYQVASLRRMDALERALTRQAMVDVVRSAPSLEHLADAVDDVLLLEDPLAGKVALSHACDWIRQQLAKTPKHQRETSPLNGELAVMEKRAREYRNVHSPSRRLKEIERQRSQRAGHSERAIAFARRMIFGDEVVRHLDRQREIQEARDRMTTAV